MKGDAAAASQRDSGLQNRRSGIGRDQFIAPVMGIQIEGDGLNLPPGVNEDEEPPKPAATEKPKETKQEETRSTSK